jgi:hypothetical protein
MGLVMRDFRGVVAVPWRGLCPAGQRKFRYRTRKLALQALALNRLTGGSCQSVYKCPACRDWHLTSLEEAPKSA